MSSAASSAVCLSSAAITATGSSGRYADALDYAQALRDSGGFNTVVAMISYNLKTSEVGEQIPYYRFTFQMR